MCQSFSEEVDKLILGVNLHSAYLIRSARDMRVEPVVLDGIVLIVRCHTLGFILASWSAPKLSSQIFVWI